MWCGGRSPALGSRDFRGIRLSLRYGSVWLPGMASRRPGDQSACAHGWREITAGLRVRGRVVSSRATQDTFRSGHMNYLPTDSDFLVVEDKEKQAFFVNREVFVSPDIPEREQRRIFDRCWIYVGHASEIQEPRRLPHPPRRRPAGHLLPRPRGRGSGAASIPAATAAPRSAGSATATRGSSTACTTAGPTIRTARSR